MRAKGPGHWAVVLIWQLLRPSLVRLVVVMHHELADGLIREIVNHLDLDLLEDLRALLQALSRRLFLELLNRSRHIDRLDRILVFLGSDD